MAFSGPDPIYCSDLEEAWVRARTTKRDRGLSRLSCTLTKLMRGTIHVGYHCRETGQSWLIRTPIGDAP